jgi:ATP-dependent HslUV protease, peptidase subunit HslV
VIYIYIYIQIYFTFEFKLSFLLPHSFTSMSSTMLQKSLLCLTRQRTTTITTTLLSTTPKLFRPQQQKQQIQLTYSNYFHTSTFNQQAQPDRHGTTIVCVRKNGQVCMMGDGMVSQGSMIVKPNALKIRRIVSKTGSTTPSSDKDNEDDKASKDKFVTIVGFAGSTADAFTLLERLESKLDEYPGQLARSCVELAKGWRTDKYLRRLEASLIVADSTCSLELTGNGDVLESHDGVLGVGSGSPYAIGTFVVIVLSLRCHFSLL